MITATNIKPDESIEVSENQYNYVYHYYNGLIARRKEDGKFFIKIWVMSFKNEIVKYLNSIK